MKRIGLILIAILLVASPVFSQTVNIPDIDFLYALIDEGVDTNEDSLISYAEAEKISYLKLGFNHFLLHGDISDVSGIEAFINLDTLILDNNRIESLDLSNNSALKYLSLAHNSLSNLDISNNTLLKSLYCSGNPMTSLDVSNNAMLEELVCNQMKLTSLDVSKNTELRILSLGGTFVFPTYYIHNSNQLINLDVTNNLSLTRLDCGGNKINNLDVSKNTKLTELVCRGNNLTALDISNNKKLEWFLCSENELDSISVEYNVELKKLMCNETGIAALDVSNNPLLEILHCYRNNLTKLEVFNNPQLTELIFVWNGLMKLNVTNNANLTELNCGGNELTYLDISNNLELEKLVIWGLENLEVCTWTSPFPSDGLRLFNNDTPNLNFTTDCVPILYISHKRLNYSDSIELTCSKEGNVYLVPENTEGVLTTIQKESIRSTSCLKNTKLTVSISDLKNGEYWFYGASESEKISDPVRFTVTHIGINEYQNSEIVIYPNPTNSLLTIETDNPDHYSINITSLNGQLIYSTTMQGTSHQIDLSSFQKGVYFITIRSDDFVTTRKVIKL